jgi:hypothetical protein
VSTQDPVRILTKIWSQYTGAEKFPAYGGSPENGVDNAPGSLDLKNTQELADPYMLSPEQLSNVNAAASLTHMMNRNMFTAAVFRLKGGANQRSLANALRENIQKAKWLCGSPEKLLIAAPENGQLLMAYGSRDAMTTLETKLKAAFPKTTVYFSETV